MTIPDAPPAPRQDDPRQAPLVVALLGAIVVAFLLFLPITATDPDPTWTKAISCGNAWSVDDSHWHSVAPDWLVETRAACGEQRTTRLTAIAATVMATLFAATFALALPRRRRSAAESEEEAQPETT